MGEGLGVRPQGSQKPSMARCEMWILGDLWCGCLGCVTAVTSLGVLFLLHCFAGPSLG